MAMIRSIKARREQNIQPQPLLSSTQRTNTPPLSTTASTATAPLIELRQIIKQFDTPAGQFIALNNVDLTIQSGKFVAILGKSGSGKSTLINIVTGIDRPTSGEVIIEGTPIHTLGRRALTQWRGENIGVVFQFFQLLPTLTLVENVMMPMEFCNLYRPRQRRERAMMLLETVEIADHAHKLPSMVSGGQQQRAAIARALANDPPLLVADEPTGNLDSQTTKMIFKLFQQLVREGKTILMVTHDEDIASRVSQVVFIADGQIVDQFDPTLQRRARVSDVLARLADS